MKKSQRADIDSSTSNHKTLSAVVVEAGACLDDIVKTTVFLEDVADFQEVNEVYAEYFKSPYPARSAFQVSALPLVQI